MIAAHLILFVDEPVRSTTFWRAVLGRAPRLDVPGMTEFELCGGAVLGLMPEVSVERLLGDDVRPRLGRGATRGELYLLLDAPEAAWERAIAAGATAVSAIAERSWGHRAGYLRDPDGHLFAVAAPSSV